MAIHAKFFELAAANHGLERPVAHRVVYVLALCAICEVREFVVQLVPVQMTHAKFARPNEREQHKPVNAPRLAPQRHLSVPTCV